MPMMDCAIATGLSDESASVINTIATCWPACTRPDTACKAGMKSVEPPRNLREEACWRADATAQTEASAPYAGSAEFALAPCSRSSRTIDSLPSHTLRRDSPLQKRGLQTAPSPNHCSNVCKRVLPGHCVRVSAVLQKQPHHRLLAFTYSITEKRVSPAKKRITKRSSIAIKPKQPHRQTTVQTPASASYPDTAFASAPCSRSSRTIDSLP